MRVVHSTISEAKAPASSRWLSSTVVLLALSVFINYIDRGNLSTAAPIIKDELHLSTTQLGFLLTAFTITYTIMQLVAGWLVDRFEAGRILVIGFIVWSLTTTLTGLAQGLAALFALRLLLGIGESVAVPAFSKIVSGYFPESKRGGANGAILGAAALGPAFGIFFGGMLIAMYGWRTFFIGFGLVSLLWIIPWLALAQKGLAANPAAPGPKLSLRVILQERSLWGASIGHTCAVYVWYFVLTWLPYYLVHERHWSLSGMAMVGGAAYLLLAGSMFASGSLVDRWIKSGASATLALKTFLAVGSASAAVFLIGCVVTNARLSVLFLMLASLALGMIFPNMFSVAQTLAGQQAAGRWVGVQNGISGLGAIIAPALTGILVDRTGNFFLPFAITAAISLLGALAWVFLVGPLTPVDWTHRTITAPLCGQPAQYNEVVPSPHPRTD